MILAAARLRRATKAPTVCTSRSGAASPRAGRYEAAYRLALLVNTVNLVALKSFTPLFYSAYGRGDRQEAAKLLRRTRPSSRRMDRALLVVLLPLIAGVHADPGGVVPHILA